MKGQSSPCSIDHTVSTPPQHETGQSHREEVYPPEAVFSEDVHHLHDRSVRCVHRGVYYARLVGEIGIARPPPLLLQVHALSFYAIIPFGVGARPSPFMASECWRRGFYSRQFRRDAQGGPSLRDGQRADRICYFAVNRKSSTSQAAAPTAATRLIFPFMFAPFA